MTKWETAFELGRAFGHGWADLGVPRDAKLFSLAILAGAAIRSGHEASSPRYDAGGVETHELASQLMATQDAHGNISPEGFRPPESEAEAWAAYAVHAALAVGMTGLTPSLTHTTGSGRLEWTVTPKGVTISVFRPPWTEDGAPLRVLAVEVPHGASTVKVETFRHERKVVRIFPDGGSRPETLRRGPEARHHEAASWALGALGYTV